MKRAIVMTILPAVFVVSSSVTSSLRLRFSWRLPAAVSVTFTRVLAPGPGRTVVLPTSLRVARERALRATIA